jgi:AcrR family transcriptional regulator
MPKLWSETVEGHRAAVRDATLDATAALVAERGLSSVTMSEVASRAGVGRATLYKYFPDVDSILEAWHERQIGDHLHQLTEIRDKGTDPREQLEAVLNAFASLTHHAGDSDIALLLHQSRQVSEAHRELHQLIEDLIADGAKAGQLRDDIPPRELATFCLHALAAASNLTTKAAARRLVVVTMTGLTRD